MEVPLCKCHGISMVKTNRSWQCRVKKDASNARYVKRKADWLLGIKVAAGCIDCGTHHPAVLVFDHRDPEQKLFSLGVWSVQQISREKIEAEIQKCDVRCENCHRIRHYNLKQEV